MIPTPASLAALAAELRDSPYELPLPGTGVPALTVFLRPEGLAYAHNLGASRRPSQADAESLLGRMEAVHAELTAAHGSWAALAALGEPCFELVVFSGHMDFRVAVRQGGQTTWHERLDP